MRGRSSRWGAPSVWAWWTAAVVAAGLWIAPSATAQERADDERRLVEILEGLEHGLVALERLGLREQHEQLQLVANDVRRELRDLRQRQGQLPGARDTDRAPRQLADELHELLAASQDEHADVQRKIAELTRDNEVIRKVIAKIEQDLPPEGTGDRRAHERAEATLADYQRRLQDNEQALAALRDQRARLEQMSRRLEAAAPGVEARARRADARHEARARDERLRKLSRHVDETLEHSRPGREAARDAPRSDRPVIEREIEVMRIALPALREAGRHDSAELLQRAIRAREVRLEGRRDREAAEIRQAAPDPAQQIELLAYAAEIWQTSGHEEKAAVVGELAERMRASLRTRDDEGGRTGPRREAPPRRDALLPRIEKLEARLAEIEQSLERITALLRATDRRER